MIHMRHMDYVNMRTHSSTSYFAKNIVGGCFGGGNESMILLYSKYHMRIILLLLLKKRLKYEMVILHAIV